MPRVRNAFTIRAADAPIMETAQFLHLYCPLLLQQLQRDDLFVPKLIVIRGSPGSGKSSLLRLFETETLLAIHGRRLQSGDEELIERLQELGGLTETGPRILGIYIQCDSSLRDIANLPSELATPKLFNTLLDIRIVVAFLRVLRRLAENRLLVIPEDCVFKALSPAEAPPRIFAESMTIAELEAKCSEIERDFGALLNSFPGDPLPASLQPHARVFSLTYLALQIHSQDFLLQLMPVVMLDDVQELYPDQRNHLKDEFIRRASIPRWLAVRTRVFGLEELIPLEGAGEGREFREIDLDDLFKSTRMFATFASNVIDRRLQHTEALQQVTVSDFKNLLRSADTNISSEVAQRALGSIGSRARDAGYGASIADALNPLSVKAKDGIVTFDELLAIEQQIVLFERRANKGEVPLFPDLALLDELDAKIVDAAILFLTKRLRRPYYYGFEALVKVASSNVEQLLSMTGAFADRMIYRAELDRDKAVSAKEQEDMIKKGAEEYYKAIEEKHRRGAAIRQLVDNLGRFCEHVTYRVNAPIAPGVNGFGLTPQELHEVATGTNSDAVLFREVLTNAVAGNVLSVRPTKQGQAGKQKIVFYMNRLLCVRFRLPLGYGGWQHLPVPLLVRMMRESIALGDMNRNASGQESFLWGSEE